MNMAGLKKSLETFVEWGWEFIRALIQPFIDPIWDAYESNK